MLRRFVLGQRVSSYYNPTGFKVVQRGSALAKYANENKLKEAVAELERRRAENDHIYKNEIYFLIKCALRKQKNYGLALFHQLSEDMFLSQGTYQIVILSYLKDKKIKEAIEVFELIKKLNIDYDETSKCIYLEIFLESGNIDKAIEEFDQVFDEPTVRAFTTMIYGLSLRKKHIQSLMFLQRMIAANYIPTHALFRRVMRGLSYDGRLDDSLSLLKVMRQCDMLPDQNIIRILLNAHCRQNKFDEAVKFLNNICLDYNVIPEPEILDDFIRELCTKKYYSQSLDVMKFAQNYNISINDKSISNLIQSAYKVNQEDESPVKIWDYYKRRLNVVDPRILVILVNYFKEQDDINSILSAVEEIELFDVRPDKFLWGKIISVGKSKDIDGTFTAFETMKRCGIEPDSYCYYCITKKALYGGSKPEALKVVNDMLKHRMPIDGKFLALFKKFKGILGEDFIEKVVAAEKNLKK